MKLISRVACFAVIGVAVTHFAWAQKVNTTLLDNNQSLYDSSFVTYLSEQYQHILLKDSLLVADGDSIVFPHLLKLNKMYEFHADWNKEQWRLIITPISYTHVRYILIIRDEQNKIIEGMRGVASIDPAFFLSSTAVGLDSISATGYEYKEVTKYCETKITIAKALNNERKVQARILFVFAEPKRKKVDKGNVPLLVSEKSF